MKRKGMLFSIMAASIFFVSGCWSKKELSDLAIISAVGIDKNEEGKYVKTIQFVNPGNVSSGLQGGGGGQSPAVTVYSAEGDTIYGAHINASSKVSRRLYHAHANLVVINEELAKEEGINVLLDSFERYQEVRSTTKLVISHGTKAGDLMKSLTAVDKIPADKINRTLEQTEQMKGENIMVSLQDFIKASQTSGMEPVLSGFRLKGDVEEGKKQENVQQSELNATLEADGLAVFKDGKLIDWYEGETARGVVWLLDRIKHTEVELGWEGKKHAIVYNVIRQNTNVLADTKKDYPDITVHIRAEGVIQEVTMPVNLSDPAVISDIEKVAEKEIKKQLEQTIKRTQKNQSDIFGFGQVVYRKDPDKWKKMKRDWNEAYFPKLNVTVKVDAYIRGTGLRTKPYLSGLE